MRGLHDQDFPERERFPRRMTAVIREDEQGRAVTEVNGRQLGDPLQDNNHHEDGYRFHDVMHLANAAMLGWSPVLRGLMGLRRRSDHETLLQEDGRRAIRAEEGITALVFSRAIRRAYFQHSPVEHDILDCVQDITNSLEVSRHNRRDWQQAIHAAYRIWLPVWRQQGGTVLLDLEARTIHLEDESARATAPAPLLIHAHFFRNPDSRNRESSPPSCP